MYVPITEVIISFSFHKIILTHKCMYVCVCVCVCVFGFFMCHWLFVYVCMCVICMSVCLSVFVFVNGCGGVCMHMCL